MEVITIESPAFQLLIERIEKIENFINQNIDMESKQNDDLWVDNADACNILKISIRTLQRLRSNNEIAYSKVGGKIYYRIGDIRELISSRRIRSTKEDLANLICKYKNA